MEVENKKETFNKLALYNLVLTTAKSARRAQRHVFRQYLSEGAPLEPILFLVFFYKQVTPEFKNRTQRIPKQALSLPSSVCVKLQLYGSAK